MAPRSNPETPRPGTFWAVTANWISRTPTRCRNSRTTNGPCRMIRFPQLYWMNLAGAYEANGDLGSAQNAFEHARSVYPLSAEVAWNYGNFLLRQGTRRRRDTPKFTTRCSRIPRLLTLAISRVWRSSHDVNVLLDQVLPADVDAYIQALDFFASIRQSDAALFRVATAHFPGQARGSAANVSLS